MKPSENDTTYKDSLSQRCYVSCHWTRSTISRRFKCPCVRCCVRLLQHFLANDCARAERRVEGGGLARTNSLCNGRHIDACDSNSCSEILCPHSWIAGVGAWFPVSIVLESQPSLTLEVFSHLRGSWGVRLSWPRGGKLTSITVHVPCIFA